MTVVMTSPGTELIRSLRDRARESLRRDNCEPVGEGTIRGTGDVDWRPVQGTCAYSGDCETLLDLLCAGTVEGDVAADLIASAADLIAWLDRADTSQLMGWFADGSSL